MSGLQPETRIDDWISVRQLGSGACGTVYMWKNSKSNEEIAIKKCKLIDNPDTMRRWKTEVDMMQGMSHNNIVSYIKIPPVLEKEYPSFCSLGMEFCSAGDLRKFIGKTEHSCGLPEYHVRDVMGDIGSAIHYLHEKHNMHRDLKPENIVLKPRPNRPHRFSYKITDLGYAKDLDITRGHTLVGTLQYLAPELVLESKRSLCYNTEVDFWSFGMVVFECSTGFRPFFHLTDTEPTLTVNLVKDKRDEDICAWHEGRDKVKFHDEIPQPHLLNPYFASDVVLWLRLMLCFDKTKRGGKDGKEWYSVLMEKVLAKKYIQVLNTTNMTLLTFPLEEAAVPRTVQMMIQRETSVADDEQLLLLGKGEVPNMVCRVLDQLRRIEPNSPDNPVIYFFDKQARQWPYHRNPTPGIVPLYSHNQTANTDYKLSMRIVLHETLSKIKLCLHIHNALFALMERVTKMSENLRMHLDEFIAENHTLAGKVHLFELSLHKDMAEAESQRDASDICHGDAYKKECEVLQKGIESWKIEIKEAKQLIKEASGELSKSRNASEQINIKEFLDSLKQNAIKFCSKFRYEYKRWAPPAPNERNFTDTPEAFAERQLKKFKEEYSKRIDTLLEKCRSPHSDTRKKMRIYTDDLTKLEKILFNIQDRRQSYSCISCELEEKQKRRQHSLWNMLRYMKEVYNIAYSYQQDPNAEADLVNSEQRLSNFMQNLINDTDLQGVLTFTPTTREQQHSGEINQPGPVPQHPEAASAIVNGPAAINSAHSEHGTGGHPLSGYDTALVQISSQTNPPLLPNGGSH